MIVVSRRRQILSEWCLHGENPRKRMLFKNEIKNSDKQGQCKNKLGAELLKTIVALPFVNPFNTGTENNCQMDFPSQIVIWSTIQCYDLL